MKNFIHNELLVIITNYLCTLKCKDCANFIYKIPAEIRKQFVQPEQLKLELENLSKVLRTNRIQIQGGEATLHKELELIVDIVTASGISNNIQLVTNATNTLNEDLIASLKRNNVNVRISNYEDYKQKISALESQLKLNSIEYSLYKYVGGDDLWYDLGEYQMKRNENDFAVNAIYEQCPYKVCWTLSDGRITKCSRSASSYIAGHHDFFKDDFVDVRNTNLNKLRVDLNKMLELKFIESCRYCNGISGQRIKPGIQIGKQKVNKTSHEMTDLIKAAFYYSMPFQLRVLEPIASEFEKTLFSNNIEEIEEWKPDVLFTSDAGQITNLRSICDLYNIQLVGLRHGVANKYIPTDPEYSMADYVCGSSWDKNDFIQCNVMPRKEFLVTGNPWIDAVFRIPMRELNEQNPTILFAPTYNPEVSAAIFFKNDLVENIRKIFPDSKIIIKPHPAILDYDHQYVAEFRQLFMDLINGWRKETCENKNVYFEEDSSVPISDFYSETDILISDGSSLIYEFMVLNRPILLYTSEHKIKRWENLYDDKALANGRRNVGAEFRTKEEFQSVLKEAFKLHKANHTAYQLAYCKEIFGEFTDGNSFKRVADSIKNVWLKKNNNQNIRLIAFNLPQYYPIPENDEAWGKGFTEWRNVAKAKPMFQNHYQPHIPSGLGFYDLRLDEVRIEQAKLAKQHGINGFCYYYYWFNGKKLLDLPLQRMIDSGKPDFPFCICWANEHWIKKCDDNANEIIVSQNHNHLDDLNFIREIIPLFKDDRYIKVNNKPWLAIYRTELFPDIKKTAEIWRNEVKKAGLDDLYLVRVESFVNNIDPAEIGFDAALEFAPDWDQIGDPISINLELKNGKQHQYIFDYRDLMKNMIAKAKPSYKRFKSVTPMWDNSARTGADPMILINSTPNDYQFWLSKTIEYTKQHFDVNEQLVFLNAWNEWGEGNHLEPDLKNGRSYLEATANALIKGYNYDGDNNQAKKLTNDSDILMEEIKTQNILEKSSLEKQNLNLNALMELSQIHIKQKNYFDAYLLLQKVLNEDCNNLPAKEKLNILNERIASMRKARNWNSKKSAKNLFEAEKYIEQQNLSEAKNKLIEILNYEPEHIEALNDLSVVAILESNYDYATELIKAVIMKEPKNEVALGNMNYMKSIPSQSAKNTKENQTKTYTHVIDDRTGNYDYQKLIKEEIDEYNNIIVTKDLQEGGIHDFDAWKYWSTYLKTKVWRSGLYEEVVKFAKKIKNPRILSLGCGYGGHEIAIARMLRHPYKIIGIDINQNLFKEARETVDKEGLSIEFELGDMNFIELEENNFDIIYAHASLHHVINLENLFYQLYKGLKPDGRLVILDVIGKTGIIFWKENVDFARELIRRMPSKYVDKTKSIDAILPQFYEPTDQKGMEGIRQEEVEEQMLKYFQPIISHKYCSFMRQICTNDKIAPNFNLKNEDDKLYLEKLYDLDLKLIDDKVLRPTEIFAVAVKRKDVYGKIDYDNEITATKLNEENRFVQNVVLKINELIEQSEKHIQHDNHFDAFMTLQKIYRKGINHESVINCHNLLNEKIMERRKEKKWNTKISTNNLLQAEKFIEKQNLHDAKDKLVEILNYELDHIEALNDLAVVSILENNYEYAKEIIELILRLDPNNEITLGNRDYLKTLIPQGNGFDVYFKELDDLDENKKNLNTIIDNIAKNKPGTAHANIIDDKTGNYNYQELVNEEIEEYNNIVVTKDLKEGGMHDFDAWKNWGIYLRTKVWKTCLYDEVSKHANRFQNPRILSLGCGYGGHEIAIARMLQHPYKIIGIDINQNILTEARETAKKEGLGIELQMCDMNFIEIEENSYDVVYAHASLHHVINLENLFYQIYNGLKPDGRLIILDVIGKSGVIFWKENVDFARELVRNMPPKYVNKKINVDAIIPPFREPNSQVGMEGIRQEEIEEQMLKYFKPIISEKYCSFMRQICTNDKIAPNFNLDDAEDKAYLEKLYDLDLKLIANNKLRPTEIFAVLEKRTDIV